MKKNSIKKRERNHTAHNIQDFLDEETLEIIKNKIEEEAKFVAIDKKTQESADGKIEDELKKEIGQLQCDLSETSDKQSHQMRIEEACQSFTKQNMVCLQNEKQGNHATDDTDSNIVETSIAKKEDWRKKVAAKRMRNKTVSFNLGANKEILIADEAEYRNVPFLDDKVTEEMVIEAVNDVKMHVSNGKLDNAVIEKKVLEVATDIEQSKAASLGDKDIQHKLLSLVDDIEHVKITSLGDKDIPHKLFEFAKDIEHETDGGLEHGTVEQKEVGMLEEEIRDVMMVSLGDAAAQDDELFVMENALKSKKAAESINEPVQGLELVVTDQVEHDKEVNSVTFIETKLSTRICDARVVDNEKAKQYETTKLMQNKGACNLQNIYGNKELTLKNEHMQSVKQNDNEQGATENETKACFRFCSTEDIPKPQCTMRIDEHTGKQISEHTIQAVYNYVTNNGAQSLASELETDNKTLQHRDIAKGIASDCKASIFSPHATEAVQSLMSDIKPVIDDSLKSGTQPPNSEKIELVTKVSECTATSAQPEVFETYTTESDGFTLDQSNAQVEVIKTKTIHSDTVATDQMQFKADNTKTCKLVFANIDTNDVQINLAEEGSIEIVQPSNFSIDSDEVLIEDAVITNKDRLNLHNESNTQIKEISDSSEITAAKQDLLKELKNKLTTMNDHYSLSDTSDNSITSTTLEIKQYKVNRTIEICKEGCSIRFNEEHKCEKTSTNTAGSSNCNTNKRDFEVSCLEGHMNQSFEGNNSSLIDNESFASKNSFIFESDVFDSEIIKKAQNDLLMQAETEICEEEKRLKKVLEKIILDDESDENKKHVENDHITEEHEMLYATNDLNNNDCSKTSIKNDNLPPVKRKIQDDTNINAIIETNCINDSCITIHANDSTSDTIDKYAVDALNIYNAKYSEILGEINALENFIFSTKNKDFNANSCLKRRENIEKRKKSFQPTNFIFADDLSFEESKLFSIWCSKKIIKMKSTNFIVKSWNWLKNIINPKNENDFYNEKEISPFFLELQNFLIFNAPKTNLIFRICSNKEHFLEIPLKIKNTCFVYDLNNKDIKDNAGVFKGYIREVLNGLFPVCISKSLVYLSNKYLSVDEMNPESLKFIKYLPFCMSKNERKILNNLFLMFNLIDLNEIETNMNYKSLAICLSPSLFEKNFIRKLKDAKVPAKLAELLFFLDYERIDKDIYEMFKKDMLKKN